MNTKEIPFTQYIKRGVSYNDNCLTKMMTPYQEIKSCRRVIPSIILPSTLPLKKFALKKFTLGPKSEKSQLESAITLGCLVCNKIINVLCVNVIKWSFYMPQVIKCVVKMVLLLHSKCPYFPCAQTPRNQNFLQVYTWPKILKVNQPIWATL